VNELAVSEGSVVENSAARGLDWMTHTAICPACGYPTVGPDLCASCRAAVVL
jgi:rubrerythrin